jgi:hypothetical protein
VTDTTYTNHAWRTISNAFAMLSRRYRPVLVSGATAGDGRFSLVRWKLHEDRPDEARGCDPGAALEFLTGAPATDEQIKSYSESLGRPHSDPVGSLFMVAKLEKQWGSAHNITPLQRCGTMIYVPAVDAEAPPGWSSLGMPLAVLSAALMHRCLLSPSLGVSDHTAVTNPTATELLRRAAGSALEQVLDDVGLGQAFVKRGASETFLQVDHLASLAYERRSLAGRLVFRAAPFRPDLDRLPKLSARFEKPVPLTNARAARKVLEMTGGERLALSEDGKRIAGIALSSPDPIPQSVEIRFAGRQSWSAAYGGRPGHQHDGLREARTLFFVDEGIPKPPIPILAEQDFMAWSHGVFDGQGADHGALWAVAQAARSASHGALVVISPAAEAEAARLGSRATRLAPERHPPSVTMGLASVDGALIVDLQGRCHAAGVILDGSAFDGAPEGLNESAARGSRFNSAVRYLVFQRQQRGVRAGALVFSEDQGVDLLPA